MNKSIARIILLIFAIFNTSENSGDETMIPQVASKLYWNVIGSVSEGPEDLRKTYSACICIAEKIQHNWSKERFKRFHQELSELHDRNHRFLESVMGSDDVSKSLFEKGPPEKSEHLNSELEKIIPIVSDCEESNDARLEF